MRFKFKNLYILFALVAFGLSSNSCSAQLRKVGEQDNNGYNNKEKTVVNYIAINNNLGFDWEETAIIKDSKLIKQHLKKGQANIYGPCSQYILIKLYGKTKGCTQPYSEINIHKGDKELVVEYKMIQRGLCKKNQSLSNTILISKAAFGQHKIKLTTPIELQTTTY